MGDAVEVEVLSGQAGIPDRVPSSGSLRMTVVSIGPPRITVCEWHGLRLTVRCIRGIAG
jgi:hypothetical protein